MTVLLVEHDMEVVFSLANKITVLHPARSSPTARRRRSRTMRRCSALSWASPDAEDGLAHYGASHILQGVDLAGRRSRAGAQDYYVGARPQRRREDHDGAR